MDYSNKFIYLCVLKKNQVKEHNFSEFKIESKFPLVIFFNNKNNNVFSFLISENKNIYRGTLNQVIKLYVEDFFLDEFKKISGKNLDKNDLINLIMSTINKDIGSFINNHEIPIDFHKTSDNIFSLELNKEYDLKAGIWIQENKENIFKYNPKSDELMVDNILLKDKCFILDFVFGYSKESDNNSRISFLK